MKPAQVIILNHCCGAKDHLVIFFRMFYLMIETQSNFSKRGPYYQMCFPMKGLFNEFKDLWFFVIFQCAYFDKSSRYFLKFPKKETVSWLIYDYAGKFMPTQRIWPYVVALKTVDKLLIKKIVGGSLPKLLIFIKKWPFYKLYKRLHNIRTTWWTQIIC